MASPPDGKMDLEKALGVLGKKLRVTPIGAEAQLLQKAIPAAKVLGKVQGPSATVLPGVTGYVAPASDDSQKLQERRFNLLREKKLFLDIKKLKGSDTPDDGEPKDEGKKDTDSNKTEEDIEKEKKQYFSWEWPIHKKFGHWYTWSRIMLLIFVISPLLIIYFPGVGPFLVLVLFISFLTELFGFPRMFLKQLVYTIFATLLTWSAFQDTFVTLLVLTYISTIWLDRWLMHRKSRKAKIFGVLLFIFMTVLTLMLISNVMQSTGDRNLAQVYYDAFQSGGEESILREAFSPKLNQLAAILKGEYDPDQQAWETRQVRDTYVVEEDAGVIFSDIGSSRSKYFFPDKLEITGDVQIVSLFERGSDVAPLTPIAIDVQLPECIPASTISSVVASGIAKFGVSTIPTGWCDLEWTCDIPGETSAKNEDGTSIPNKFEISRAYNRFFTCTYDSFQLDESDQDLIFRPSVTWKYTTQAVSGRQIFVAHPDTLAKVDDLRNHYNIPDTAFDPWSISDGTVDFGVGFDREVEFLRAEGPGDVLNEDGEPIPDRFTSYFLGVSLKNNQKGDIVKIRELELEIPQDDDILILNNDGQPIEILHEFIETSEERGAGVQTIIKLTTETSLSSTLGRFDVQISSTELTFTTEQVADILSNMNDVVLFDLLTEEANAVLQKVSENSALVLSQVLTEDDFGEMEGYEQLTTVGISPRQVAEVFLSNRFTEEDREDPLLSVYIAAIEAETKEVALNKRSESVGGAKSGNFVFSHTEYQNEDPDTGSTQPVDVYKLVDATGKPIDLNNQYDLDKSDNSIEAGAFETYYLRLSIKEAYLDNTAYQSFFVKARLTYDYENDKKTSLRLEAPLAIGGPN